jgi:hypothetical protein
MFGKSAKPVFFVSRDAHCRRRCRVLEFDEYACFVAFLQID